MEKNKHWNDIDKKEGKSEGGVNVDKVKESRNVHT